MGRVGYDEVLPEDAVTHKTSAATSLAECSPGNDFNRGR
ncbi:hypothetical protein BZL30_6561 [Mycobacterium kansasii]|uniref:Uncharacterized protein n=1 Tax=Mycobacterium kansasii TaxID=1768 RepID=A0A1V3WUL2_MYCKA|nr:hypothetical protein BZL30_6561 [Mycobacterium kansasii]